MSNTLQTDMAFEPARTRTLADELMEALTDETPLAADMEVDVDTTPPRGEPRPMFTERPDTGPGLVPALAPTTGPTRLPEFFLRDEFDVLGVNAIPWAREEGLDSLFDTDLDMRLPFDLPVDEDVGSWPSIPAPMTRAPDSGPITDPMELQQELTRWALDSAAPGSPQLQLASSVAPMVREWLADSSGAFNAVSAHRAAPGAWVNPALTALRKSGHPGLLQVRSSRATH